MKWLFAILVALNIVVFGCMVAGKLVGGFSAKPATKASSEVEIAAPATPSISVRNADVANTDSNHAENNANPPKPVIKTEAAPNIPAKTESKKDTDLVPNSPVTAKCSATVTLPENDFHRIKGLLRQWPYSTSRFVEQVGTTVKPNPMPKSTRYMVTLNSIDDDTRQRLQEQGFDHGSVQGKVSLGIFNLREDAEALMARAKAKGFNGAFISTLENSHNNNGTNASTSIAKMRVVFTGVDNSAIQDINKITGRYGQIQRSAACR